ncbi:YggS family pyridoxal phosphate-dependent enzyme [Candidatus Omnitrophota bacterium]
MIQDNVRKILEELPAQVELEAAAKTRSVKEIEQAVAGGVKIIGENYVQEAESAQAVIGRKARWHFIGHLQKNKVKKAVKIFDLIETLDSQKLAEALDQAAAGANKVMPVLVEVNSAGEQQKFGVLPERVLSFIKGLLPLNNIKVVGLMTMGPAVGDPAASRPYFEKTKRIFERIKDLDLDGLEMKYLSMGMSDTYQIAIEEGANIVRVGSAIFGPRE